MNGRSVDQSRLVTIASENDLNWTGGTCYWSSLLLIITKHVNNNKHLTFNKILQWQARYKFPGGQKYAMLPYGIMRKLFSVKLKLFYPILTNSTGISYRSVAYMLNYMRVVAKNKRTFSM